MPALQNAENVNECKVILYYTLSVQLVNDETRYQACLFDARGNISSYISLKIWLIKCVVDISKCGHIVLRFAIWENTLICIMLAN